MTSLFLIPPKPPEWLGFLFQPGKQLSKSASPDLFWIAEKNGDEGGDYDILNQINICSLSLHMWVDESKNGKRLQHSYGLIFNFQPLLQNRHFLPTSLQPLSRKFTILALFSFLVLMSANTVGAVRFSSQVCFCLLLEVTLRFVKPSQSNPCTTPSVLWPTSLLHCVAIIMKPRRQRRGRK